MKSYVQLCLAVSNQMLAQSRASFKPTNTAYYADFATPFHVPLLHRSAVG